MFIRHLYRRCDVGSSDKNGFSARWYWSEFDEAVPREHEGLKISNLGKTRFDLIRTEPKIGDSIEISSTGTLYCNLDDKRYNISSHTPKIKYDIPSEAREVLEKYKILDFISPIFVYKQLKKGESNLSFPDIVVDLIFHDLNELKITSKKFNLPLEEKVRRDPRSLEQMWSRGHGVQEYF